jgi:NADH dehydrogenase
MRNLCLLGGAGFVGKALVNRFFKAGWQVRVLTRQREKHRELLVLPSLDLVATDYSQEQLNQQLAGCDVVINLVGILNEPGNDGAGFRKAHVELLQKVITACQANQIKRLLHLSALNANAKQETSHYLRTKGEAEDLIHNVQDLQVTSFRPSVIFGEKDSFLNRFVQLLRVPSPIFMLPSAEAKLAPVWVNDVVEAVFQSVDNYEHYGKRYNLCGPNVYTLQALVKYTADLIGVKRWIIPLGDKSSARIARLFELKLIPGKPYSLDNYHSSKIDSVCGDNNHLSQLGITPHAIETIMPKYFAGVTPRELYSTFRCQAHRAV